MSTFLIILGFLIIPSLVGQLYMYVTVKYGLWNWVAKMALCSGGDKINRGDVQFMLLPIGSFLSLVIIIILNVGTLLYWIFGWLSYPFVKLFEWISNGSYEFIKKIEKKNEFYDIMNKKN